MLVLRYAKLTVFLEYEMPNECRFHVSVGCAVSKP